MSDYITHKDSTNLNGMVEKINNFNLKQGWRDNANRIIGILENVDPTLVPVFNNYVAGTMIALIHSELSEALEGLRKNLMDDHLTDRKMVEVELADAIIRIFDYAGHFDLDLGGAVAAKDAYNHSRSDHKKENRMKDGGKKF